MICSRCGRCCQQAFLSLNNDKDLADWLRYHRCDIVKFGTGNAVVIPLTCMNLEVDSENKYSCRIYETRPEICKKHWCNRAKVA